MRLFLTLLIVPLLLAKSFAQPGADCSDPIIIDTLPYLETGFSTENFPNTYGDNNACGSSYMQGNDIVFSFTPDSSILAKVLLKNTGFMVGVSIFDGYPDNILTNCIGSASDNNGNPEIRLAPLDSGITYYIIVSTRVILPGFYDFTEFDIEVSEELKQDVRPWIFYRPISHHSLTNDEIINIEVKNVGTDTIQPFQVGYQIDNLPIEYDFYPTPIPPNEKRYYTFTATGDFSEINHLYHIKTFTNLTGDLNINNDTMYYKVRHLDSIASFPYFEDFEASDGGWFGERTFMSASPTSWEWGTIAGDSITTAYSGNKAWGTNVDGLTNRFEWTYLQSPCFNFENLTAPIIEMKIWYETATFDYCQLQYSDDTAYLWNTIGNINEGYNWYNTPAGISDLGWTGSSDGWITVRYPLDILAGKKDIMFRLEYKVGGNELNEGFAVDDIYIYESPDDDLGVNSVVFAETVCGLSDSETVTIEYENYGLQPQVGFILKYAVNNGSVITSTITDTIHPGEIAFHSFDIHSDFSLPGIYSITAGVELSTDTNQYNDTITQLLYHFTSIQDDSYFTDFESDDGGWMTVGEGSSWEYGTPSDSAIGYAYSGSHAWCTNVDGSHYTYEQSYLYSPCFDLSQITDPILMMNLWWELAQYSYVQFEATTDGGNSWILIDIDADSLWYNQGHSWNNSSGDWVQVQNSIQALAGMPQVQFRFNFNGGLEFPGFAMDDFRICNKPVSGFSYFYDGMTVHFTDTSSSSYSYSWDFGDGNTSNEQNPVHTFVNADTVFVTQVTGNDCSADTSVVQVIITGINKFSMEGKIQIYPNPADERLYIVFNDFYPGFSVQITDLCGKIVSAISEHNEDRMNPLIIETGYLAPGTYLVEITGEKGIYREKIVIQ